MHVGLGVMPLAIKINLNEVITYLPWQDNVEEMPGAMMLVGNKVDLEESSEREVSTETGETFAKVSHDMTRP